MQGHSAPPATSTTHQLVAQPRKVRLSFRKRSTDVEKAAHQICRFATTSRPGPDMCRRRRRRDPRRVWGCHGGGCGVSPLLACRVGARRVHVTADVRVERPERRGSAAYRETWGCRGRGSGGSAVAAAGAVRCRGGAIGGGVVCCRWRAMGGLGGGGRASAGVRIERSGRRGSVARRETHERRGRGVGARAAAAAGVVTMRARRAARARVESERCEGCGRRCRPSSTGRHGLCGSGITCCQG